jgi:hypothetical protein
MCSTRADLGTAARLEHDACPGDVGLEEGPRPVDRSVDVRLGREVHHRVRVRHQPADQLGVADVTAHEPVPRVVLDVGQEARLPA